MFKLVLIIFFSATTSFASGDLSDSPCVELTDSCEFYSCIEEELKCGKRGYPIDFGMKYCNQYDRKIKYFSKLGSEWVQKTKTCLINKIIGIENLKSCDDLKKQAFKHHSPCYLDAGYCELTSDDKTAVLYIIQSSLFNSGVIREGFKLVKQCYENKK